VSWIDGLRLKALGTTGSVVGIRDDGTICKNNDLALVA
jgi:hypothetical protein